MEPRTARRLSAATAVVACATIAYVAPYWWEPTPLQGEILDAAQRRDFAAADTMIKSFLFVRKGEPIAKLFRGAASTTPDAGAPRETEPVVITPRDRCYGDPMHIFFRDPRPDAATREYYIRLEMEGRELRNFGPTAPGAASVPLNPGDTLGPPGAAGRVVIRDRQGEIASSNFVVLDPELEQDMKLRLAVIDRVAEKSEESALYFRAMAFSNERCYSDALISIERLWTLAPNDAVIDMLRRECWHAMRLRYPS